MQIETATPADFVRWLDLAAEVEHLFGPMVGEESFRQALVDAIDGQRAFCTREGNGTPGSRLCGGVVIDHACNGIEWLAVVQDYRGKRVGRSLLQFAVSHLDPAREVVVQTFAPGVPEGAAARHLYLSLGFRDRTPADPTPAGIPTVHMARPHMLRGAESSGPAIRS